MSNEEADKITEAFERKWDSKQAHKFLSRMEKKFNRKERSGRY